MPAAPKPPEPNKEAAISAALAFSLVLCGCGFDLNHAIAAELLTLLRLKYVQKQLASRPRRPLPRFLALA